MHFVPIKFLLALSHRYCESAPPLTSSKKSRSDFVSQYRILYGMPMKINYYKIGVMYNFSDTITMKDREFIACQGDAFKIEWYYAADGKSQAFEYYESLSMTERISVLRLFKRMGDIGIIKDTTRFNYEGNQIYTFKPQPDRFLCFFLRRKKLLLPMLFKKRK